MRGTTKRSQNCVYATVLVFSAVACLLYFLPSYIAPASRPALDPTSSDALSFAVNDHGNSTMASFEPPAAKPDAPYWLESIEHRGRAPYHHSGVYKVFRNVRDYGAVGDGVVDDSAAIMFVLEAST
jgi:hypothetical protein